MVRFKDTVSFQDMRPQLVFAIMCVDQINTRHYGEFRDTWITSVCDGAAGRVAGSLHNYGYAADFSIKGHPNAQEWKDKIAARLGPEFDVVLHDVGSGDHIHVEYDIRRVMRQRAGQPTPPPLTT